MVKTIVEGARRRYQVAAAETGAQDSWQRAELGFSAISPSTGHAQEVVDAVERFVWSFPEAEVLGSERFWLDTTDR